MIMVKYPKKYGDRCLVCLWRETLAQHMVPVLERFEVVYMPQLVCAKCEQRRAHE